MYRILDRSIDCGLGNNAFFGLVHVVDDHLALVAAVSSPPPLPS